MGLSYAEKEGCRQILYKLDITDLLSLYQTVVKTKPAVQNKAELIEKIIENSNTAAELLNRRKVCKDIIFQYLNNKHISIHAKSTKYDGMQKALEHWQPQPLLNSFMDECTSLGATYRMQKYDAHQNDTDVWSSPNTVHRSTIRSSITSQKSQDFSFFGENAPSKLTVTSPAHQNDIDFLSHLNTGIEATLPSRITPRKSKDVHIPGENVFSKLTVTNQITDQCLIYMRRRDGKKDHYVEQEETKAANKLESGSVKQTKDETKDYYAKRDTKAAIKAELGSVKETKDKGKDHHIQHEDTKNVNKETPGSVKETKQSATTTPQTCKEYDTEYKGASFHYIKEASQNCLPSSHCEVLPHMEHLIKMMSDQQKKQDQQYHIVQQLLDMQKENSEQLKDLKETQQIDQHEVLLLQLKENKNHQLFVTDLLQEIKNLVQQQNSLIFLQLQKQQQDFQAKLMKDLAKNTEEQVNVLLQTFYKCTPHQISYDKQSPREESGLNVKADLLNTHSSSTTSPGNSQDQPPANFTVPIRDKQGRELIQCEPVGQAFCNQFYPLWNSQNPSNVKTENFTWGPQLFGENATAEMINYDIEKQVLERYDGAECVSDSLLNFTKQERLEFWPSIDNERFKCVNSKHGLVVVAVTGTIFRDERVIGIFEQTFGLIKCPERDIFKIKFTNLKTKYFNHTDDPVTVPILSYTTEQLENM